MLGGRGRDGSGLSLDRPAGDGGDGDGGDFDFIDGGEIIKDYDDNCMSLDRPAGDGADGDGGYDLDFGADGDD